MAGDCLATLELHHSVTSMFRVVLLLLGLAGERAFAPCGWCCLLIGALHHVDCVNAHASC